MILRDYQQAAVNAVWSYFQSGKTGNPIIAMPTGTGKSLVNAELIRSMVQAFPATRIVCLTHVKELIENNYATLMRLWPSAPAGVYSAGLKRKDIHAPITFAGIASIAKRAKLFRNTDIILIDECHLVSDNDSARYVQFIAALKAYNPHLKVIGLSATPYRLGLGHLVDGKLFDEVCFDITSGEAFVWMVENGYLCPVVPKRTTVEIDVENVRMSGGEFLAASLNESIDAQDVIGAALEEAVRSAADRQHWLIFASSINHCEEIVRRLEDLGVPAKTVHSKLPDGERDQAIADFRAGRIRALVNKDILTTGFDFPLIDCIIMLRPTQSPGLWVQMLGRGTRPVFAQGFDLSTGEGRLAAIAASPKQNCLVLDFAGNTMRLGPINYPTLPKKKRGGGGEPPSRVCPQCETIVHISVKCCPECGYAFPPPKKLTEQASTEELIAKRKPVKEPEPPRYEIFEVEQMMAVRHSKAGKPDSVRVIYYTACRRAMNQYVGLQHEGWFKVKSRDWCKLHVRTRKDPVPTTTDELLDAFPTLRTPTHIKVLMNGKYPEITAYDFTGTGFDPQRLVLDPSQGAHSAPAADRGADRGGPPLPELPDLHEFF